MIAVLGIICYLDNRLDQLDLTNTVWQHIFFGRTYLPAGLPMLVLFLCLVPLGAMELCTIFKAKGIDPDLPVVTVSGWSGLLLMYIIPERMPAQTAIPLFATVLTVMFMLALIRHNWMTRRTEGAVTVAGVTMLAFVYMGLFPGFLIAIRRWHSAWVLIAVILIVKACDIGAYFTGKAIGRHKLIPWLSPGKTWEGLVGGVLLSGIIAAAIAMISNHYHWPGIWVKAEGGRIFQPYQFPVVSCFFAGMVMGVVGQFGDLTASLFKRDAGLKDSGSVIPGFGGIIDVIDSPIVVAPLAYRLLAIAEMNSHIWE